MNKVAIVMGSQSDYDIMQKAIEPLESLEISYEVLIVSAHRTPERLYDFAKNASNNGFRVIIAGAGGAAHLPGMLASLTTVPVLGVPIPATILNGLDSLLSIVQMPKGIGVATFAIGSTGAYNAALFATQILAIYDTQLAEKLRSRREQQTSRITCKPCFK